MREEYLVLANRLLYRRENHSGLISSMFLSSVETQRVLICYARVFDGNAVESRGMQLIVLEFIQMVDRYLKYSIVVS